MKILLVLFLVTSAAVSLLSRTTDKVLPPWQRNN